MPRQNKRRNGAAAKRKPTPEDKRNRIQREAYKLAALAIIIGEELQAGECCSYPSSAHYQACQRLYPQAFKLADNIIEGFKLESFESDLRSAVHAAGEGGMEPRSNGKGMGKPLVNLLTMLLAATKPNALPRLKRAANELAEALAVRMPDLRSDKYNPATA